MVTHLDLFHMEEVLITWSTLARTGFHSMTDTYKQCRGGTDGHIPRKFHKSGQRL